MAKVYSTVNVAEPTRRPVIGASSSRPNKARQPTSAAPGAEISAQPMRRIQLGSGCGGGGGAMACTWAASNSRNARFSSRRRRVCASSTGAVASGSVVLSCCVAKGSGGVAVMGLKNIDTKRCDGNYEGSGKDLKRGIAWKKCGLVRIGCGGGLDDAKK